MIGTRAFPTPAWPEPCDTGALHGDLQALAVLVVERLRGLDPPLARQLHDEWRELDRDRVAAMLLRARSRGELGDDVDPDPELVRAMLVGPLAWPLLTSQRPTAPPQAVAALVVATLH
jgi:hypothetical protein